ncbi:MAG: hypothetical protein M1840_006993 [Geoglossum simile]|nr:MAG: hypothetical protein M1840_006993 [Geoglossum simile]
MSVTKTVLEPGNGIDKAREGDTVCISISIFLYDESNTSNDFKGNFLSEVDHTTTIALEDEIPKMSLGEWVTLRIPPELGYGEKGYLNLIPPNTTLLVEAELLQINDKKVQARRHGVLQHVTTLERGNSGDKPAIGNVVTADYYIWGPNDKSNPLYQVLNGRFILDQPSSPLKVCLLDMSPGQKVKAYLESGHTMEVKLNAINGPGSEVDIWLNGHC